MSDFNNQPGDKFFTDRNVKPPERISHGIHDDPEELEKIMKKNLEGHECKFFQRGNEIFCAEGEFEHGKRISPNMRLASPGTNSVELVPFGPILRTKTDSA